MLAAHIAAVRHFSRYYTQRIGILEDSLLGSGLSLPQGRLLFEIARSEGGRAQPGQLAAALRLDNGYVSRLIASLEAAGLVRRQASPGDGRSTRIALTDSGRDVVRDIDRRSGEQIGGLIGSLAGPAQARVVAAMRTIEQELEGAPVRPGAWSIREPAAGEIGWVVHRHGVLYAAEYGWDWTFEALVAKVAGQFIENFDPTHDRCCVADVDGAVVGSAFVVRSETPNVAKLRLVYVEPAMRGSGLGRALVETAMDFARQAGYTRMTLWTNDVLEPARRLYQRLEFQKIASEPYRGFGRDLVGETWERDL